MLGFFADAVTEDLVRSEEELEDLRWFTRQELANGGAGIAKRPRSDSIARQLIDEWIRMEDCLLLFTILFSLFFTKPKRISRISAQNLYLMGEKL